jgi:hypothetical protein
LFFPLIHRALHSSVVHLRGVIFCIFEVLYSQDTIDFNIISQLQIIQLEYDDSPFIRECDLLHRYCLTRAVRLPCFAQSYPHRRSTSRVLLSLLQSRDVCRRPFRKNAIPSLNYSHVRFAGTGNSMSLFPSSRGPLMLSNGALSSGAKRSQAGVEYAR